MAKDTESKRKPKKDELVELTIEYRNKMAAEKLRKLKLGNDTVELDLRKKEDTICYRAVAMKAFENAIGDVYNRIKNMPEQLVAQLQLNPQQAALLDNYVNDLLDALSEMDVQIESTTEFDAANYYAGKARKAQLLATE